MKKIEIFGSGNQIKTGKVIYTRNRRVDSAVMILSLNKKGKEIWLAQDNNLKCYSNDPKAIQQMLSLTVKVGNGAAAEEAKFYLEQIVSKGCVQCSGEDVG